MVDGLKSLERKFMAMPKEILAQNRKDLAKGANELTTAMRRATQSSRIANSIEWEFGKGLSRGEGSQAAIITAGGTSTLVPGRTGPHGGWFDLAKLFEFGWEDRPGGFPFFFPIYRSLRKRVRSRITRGTRNAIKRIAANSAGGGRRAA